MGIICCFIWLIATSLTLCGCLLAFRKFKLNPKIPKLRKEPITILKAVCGINSDFKENVRTFFLLNYYPGDELIFCSAKEDDPVLRLVKDLIKEYPHIPARIVCEPTTVGMNPKINNIFAACMQANNDLILISDDNAIASHDYLLKLNSEFTNGILSAVILGQNAKSLGGLLEQTMMATFYGRGLLLAHLIKHPCVMGKSMMFRRSELGAEALKHAGQFLAEDYAMGKLAKSMGYKVKLMSIPVYQNIGKYTLGDFWIRHIRWGRLRKYQALWAFVPEPLFYSIVVTACVGAFGISVVSPNLLRDFLIAHFSIWLGCDILLLYSLDQPLSIAPLFVWLLREVTYPFMWVQIALGDSIYWRGRRFKLHVGGKVSLKH